MARGDGMDRTCARNVKLTIKDVANTQAHNEREKESYVNQDVVPERSNLNVHFKTPTDTYLNMFNQMVEEKTISTRGLKADAEKFGELVFDVNSAYFYNHGGYEFAKQFYADAYRAAAEILGGEQYILSAVMHADERNRAMSDALGEDVYHYHLHVVYIPVVEKQVLWTKRCKDPALVGTVKETIHQVSMSKKWISEPVIGDDGKPLLTKAGKAVLRSSYSVLQDEFFNYMNAAGYTDIQRGEQGSSEEHLTVTQFKVEKEQERLVALTEKTQQKEQQVAVLGKEIEKIQKQKVAVAAVEQIQPKSVPMTSKVVIERSEFENLTTMAKKYIAQERKERRLQKALDAANQKIQELTARIKELTDELFQFKSVRRILNPTELEKENSLLKEKVRQYEEGITRYDLWHLLNRKPNEKQTMEDIR